MEFIISENGIITIDILQMLITLFKTSLVGMIIGSFMCLSLFLMSKLFDKILDKFF